MEKKIYNNEVMLSESAQLILSLHRNNSFETLKIDTELKLWHLDSTLVELKKQLDGLDEIDDNFYEAIDMFFDFVSRMCDRDESLAYVRIAASHYKLPISIFKMPNLSNLLNKIQARSARIYGSG